MTTLELEDTVARESGPTVARWQLGQLLKKLREDAGVTYDQAAQELDCGDSKIRKIESGDLNVRRPDLVMLMRLYGFGEDHDFTARAADLARQGRERDYFESYGSVPPAIANLFGVETAATTIRVFQPSVVDGLLQTEDYARAVLEGTWIPGSPPIEQQVSLRMKRQEIVLEGDWPQMWFVMDESVIRRVIGGVDVMKAQLQHLLDMAAAKRVTVQVVPFTHGAYHGTVGSVTILEFDDDTHSPVAYADGYAGTSYMERSADLARCTLAYTHMSAAALSPAESVRLIRGTMQDL